MFRLLAVCCSFSVACALSANAACTDSASRIPSEVLVNFTMNPASLLEEFPRGTPMMTSNVADLASASLMALQPLAQIARSANESQSESIGLGLARASRSCRGRDNAMASAIIKLGSRSSNSIVAASFRASSDGDDDGNKAFKPKSFSDDGNRASIMALGRNSQKLPDPFAPIPIQQF